MYNGIDVSDCNGVIDWRLVNVDFAVLRATKKSGSADKQFVANVKGCRENGIPFDVYKYTYARNNSEAVAEANGVIDLLKSHGIDKCCVWWDVEDSSLRSIDKNTLTSVIKSAQREITGAGYSFGIYTGLSFYKEGVFNTTAFSCPFWIARYPSSAYMTLADKPNDKYIPSISNPMIAWQYTSKGRVDGISGSVDLDIAWTQFWEDRVSDDCYSLPHVSEVFKICGIPYTYESRKMIANANGLASYTGTVEENMWLIALLIQGKLKKI